MWLQSGLYSSQSSFFTPYSVNQYFMDFTLWLGQMLCLNCCHKVGSLLFCKIIFPRMEVRVPVHYCFLTTIYQRTLILTLVDNRAFFPLKTPIVMSKERENKDFKELCKKPCRMWYPPGSHLRETWHWEMFIVVFWCLTILPSFTAKTILYTLEPMLCFCKFTAVSV